MTTAIDRIKHIADENDITLTAMERMIGASKGVLSKAFRNKTDIQLKWITKISEVFPVWNFEWILTGRGEETCVKVKSVTITNDDGKIIYSSGDTDGYRPRLPMKVAAGLLTGFAESAQLKDCELVPVIKSFPDYDFTMIITGDSMEPKFEGGDEIAIKRVVSVIEWGKPYVLDTRDGAVLKRIYNEGNKLRCVSYNDEYPDFTIDKSDVLGIYRIVGQLRF